MTQCGHLTFFTEQSIEDPKRVLIESAHLAGTRSIHSVMRSAKRDRSWRRFKRERIIQRWALQMPLPSTSWIVGLLESMSAATPEEVAEVGLSLESITPQCREANWLRLLLSGTRGFVDELNSACSRSIPIHVNDIENGFCINDVYLTVGYHDIWEAVENPNGVLFGNAHYSFELFGYGSPYDWAQYRELVFEVPAMKQLARNLNEIAGSLDRCVYWTV